MSALSDNYRRIIAQIEQKITNKEDLDFVKEKIEELSNMFLNFMDEISVKTEERINKIEEKQNIIAEKVNNVAKAVDEMENDIYDEEDIDDEIEQGYEFEIVCPYCNKEFIEEIDEDEEQIKNEIECPECHNIIELDWNGEDEEKEDCSASGCDTCSKCNKNKREDEQKDNNDDDM